jgi:hypothetical protein
LVSMRACHILCDSNLGEKRSELLLLPPPLSLFAWLLFWCQKDVPPSFEIQGIF